MGYDICVVRIDYQMMLQSTLFAQKREQIGYRHCCRAINNLRKGKRSNQQEAHAKLKANKNRFENSYLG
jgi:hypothetical protein